MRHDTDMLQTNTDSYRTVLEIYLQLRKVIRHMLADRDDSDWETAAIPDELRGYLEGRRERESAISWRLSAAEDLLDYAGFANLGEIIAADPALLRQFSSIASDSQVLRTRFLEIDTVCNRLAFGREVSERDLELLTMFHTRLRRLPVNGDGDAAPAKKRKAPPRATSAEHETVPAAAAETTSSAAAAAGSQATKPSSSDSSAGPGKGEGKPTPQRLKAALESADENVVLAYLYHEVTMIAEKLWTDGRSPKPWVWEQVRESPWYEGRFGALGLKSLSDFYSIVDEVSGEERSREDVQTYLNERQFAQTLLSLRDMFRKAT